MAFNSHRLKFEKRKEYKGSKRFDMSCRNHGSCSYCESNRTHRNARQELAARELEAEGDLAMDPEDSGMCHVCKIRMATWAYMPGTGNYCDVCVPRGCSCTMEPENGDYENPDAKWVYALDTLGRKIPCCEYSQIL